MLKKLKTNQKGFTIIEVMIVLAIAALIILIVLLAVPALQRNSRNTAIKNDASAVAAAVSEYESNNEGAIPGYVDNTTAGQAVLWKSSSKDGNGATAKVQPGTTVKLVTDYPSTSSPAETGQINVAPKFKCPDTLGGALVANNRSVAVTYLTESSGTPAKQCIDA